MAGHTDRAAIATQAAEDLGIAEHHLEDAVATLSDLAIERQRPQLGDARRATCQA